MTAALIIIVHLLAWVWVVWSMGMLLRLRRENAALAAAAREATARLQAMNGRGLRLVPTVEERRRQAKLRGLPDAIFGDGEGRN